MLLYIRLTFCDELSVFWHRFSSQFRLILHLDTDLHLNVDPDPGVQPNADLDPDPKH
jgi:hypothetical protein